MYFGKCPPLLLFHLSISFSKVYKRLYKVNLNVTDANGFCFCKVKS